MNKMIDVDQTVWEMNADVACRVCGGKWGGLKLEDDEFVHSDPMECKRNQRK